MKNFLATTVLAVFLLTSMLHPAQAQAGSGDPFAAILEQRMPELLAKYRVPGAVVSYIQNGAVVWSAAYGLADLGKREPMTTEMIFNFGSTGKVLASWGVMWLVEQGRLDLDAPVNQYLTRWQIRSDQFDPAQVTLRRLLSHTAGLTVSGLTDYSPRRRLPTLAEVLDGQNQLDGKTVLFQEPGTGFQYSGGGYAIIQMVIEDVTGEPFAQYMEREITGPLRMPSLEWTWTDEAKAAAPTPYGPQQERLEYRQLACYAAGSEVGSVPDYARFVAAVVAGPQNAPVGRGVLTPETIASMTTVQPGASDEGLGYGVTSQGRGKLLQHFGANDGFTAFFSIDTASGDGIVMADNSSNGFPLNAAVQNLWLAYLADGSSTAYEPAPAPAAIPLAGLVMLVLAGMLAVPFIVCLAIFLTGLLKGRRQRAQQASRAGILGTAAWGLALCFWLYWFYTPLPLPFAPSFPDLWRMPQTELVTAVLVAWVVFSLVSAWYPRQGSAL